MQARTMITAIWLMLIAMLVITACQPKPTVCLSEDPAAPVLIITPLPTTVSAEEPDGYLAPAIVMIGGRETRVDKVVHGSFCADEWRGVVYVDCDAEVAEWVKIPNFLDDCGLTIDEGTVVYVAAHNNQAYYKGCSCHYTDEQYPGSP